SLLFGEVTSGAVVRSLKIPGCWASSAWNAGLYGAKMVRPRASFKMTTRLAAVTALTSVAALGSGELSSGLWLAAVATDSLTMPCGEPAPSLGTRSQAGPKMSPTLVTPLLVGAAASSPGAAASLAGAAAWFPVAGSCELVHATPTTLIPTAATAM